MARRSSAWWAAVLPVLGVAALAAAAVILFTDADPAPERAPAGPTVAEIAARPGDYDGRRVTLEATVLEPPGELPPGADGAFVVTGEEASRVLVIPSREGAATGLEEGALVEVGGIVQAPETVADERVETPRLTRADLIGRTGADAVVAQARVSPLGR